MSADSPEPLPENYRAVLAVVDDAGPGRHLSAHDVWSRARERRPRIGFATVHRALLRLQEAGRLLKIDVPGAAMAYYEPAVSPHAHFRCTRCARILDVPFVLPAATVDALAASQGVTIDGATLTFSGRCAACAAGT